VGEQFVRRLGSDRFAEREAAARELEKLGKAALPALRRGLDSDDPEVRRRSGALLDWIEGKAARERNEVEAEVLALGGKVAYDQETPGNPVDLVRLSGLKVTDAGVGRLAGRPGLAGVQFLFLDGTDVSAAGLAHLEGLTALKALNLAGTRVSDAGLVHLKGLGRLKYLHLEETPVTDVGLAHLRGLRSLTDLYLHGTKVTEAGVAGLRKARPDLRISR
jgi:hypothetical protein